MTKASEIITHHAVGKTGREYALNKPFSVDLPGDLLISFGFSQRFFSAPPARILDFGCGTGMDKLDACKDGLSVVGQDISPEMIRLAKENKARYAATNLEFKVCDYETS